MVWLRVHLFWILIGVAFVWIHTNMHDWRGREIHPPRGPRQDDQPEPGRE